MTVYVALLRGVNVGGRNKLPMATLRAVATGCGFGDVETYIQSGNAVFRSPLGAAKVETTLHDAILAATGVDSRVVLRTAAELPRVVIDNPFLARGADEKMLHVTFLYRGSTPMLDAVDAQLYAPDEVAVIGAHAYLHTPNGLGRSKIAAEPLIRKLGLHGTTRNWRTVTRLAEMAATMG